MLLIDNNVPAQQFSYAHFIHLQDSRRRFDKAMHAYDQVLK